MESPSLVLAISKLAVAGERAGFTLEEMIELLDDGLSVATLLELIALASPRCPPGTRDHVPLSLSDVV